MVLNIHGVEVRDLIFHRIRRLIPITNDELIITRSFVILLVLQGKTIGFHPVLLPLSFHDSIFTGFSFLWRSFGYFDGALVVRVQQCQHGMSNGVILYNSFLSFPLSFLMLVYIFMFDLRSIFDLKCFIMFLGNTLK